MVYTAGVSEARFRATVALKEVAKTATSTRASAESNGFLTLLSDGERLTGAYALGPEAGEWLQQATLAIRAGVPFGILRDVIRPFPTFSEIDVNALKALCGEITAARQPVPTGPVRPEPGGKCTSRFSGESSMTTAAGFVNVARSAALLGDQPDARREQPRMTNRAVTGTTSRHRAQRSRTASP